ncbi:hypothetical protein FLJC2902T_05100 [Flavobacterium limnosediminis JC2902]|uniref:Uncharacterized protein n=1 Tax=Flavobacterium limnosediminis JC2902 TaxID=1341181 RepID=V6T023_9FLAO|nr:hypothetical protein FLJC2902T_05100 [Flavobacterium limnosediminis JC2902]
MNKPFYHSTSFEKVSTFTVLMSCATSNAKMKTPCGYTANGKP